MSKWPNSSLRLCRRSFDSSDSSVCELETNLVFLQAEVWYYFRSIDCTHSKITGNNNAPNFFISRQVFLDPTHISLDLSTNLTIRLLSFEFNHH